MAKDKANIFKLPKDIQQEYSDNHFFDCTPGADNFAECLKQSILAKETPYVTLLESHFGMGKTYFCTRFTQYLRDNDIHAIYFSAWENDYLIDPFLSFSKEITKYFHRISLEKKVSELCDKALSSMMHLIINLAKATSLSAGVNFGVEAKVSVNNEKVIEAFEKLFDEFKEEKDAIQIFKEEFTSFIESLPEQRLVLVVDELDRCRPDYAMKTLEIIKHFFDIEGLFIIIPTNEDSLNRCVISLYGNFESAKDSECYFNKFFNQRESLYEPDYHKMVEDYLTADKLIKEISSSKLSDRINKYNSFSTLQEKLALYGKIKKLTIREMTYACEKALYICKYTTERIDSDYIAFAICNSFKKSNGINCQLTKEHPFYNDSEKQKLLTFQLPQGADSVGFTSYPQDFQSQYPDFTNRRFQSYREFNRFVSKVIEDFKKDFPRQPSRFGNFDFSSNLGKIKEYILTMKKNIHDYQKHWGSNDNDEKVKRYYDSIIMNEYKIHTR